MGKKTPQTGNKREQPCRGEKNENEKTPSNILHAYNLGVVYQHIRRCVLDFITRGTLSHAVII